MHDPSSAECGMLRAIAGGVVEEAGRHGSAHAEFHHYSIDALRGPKAGRRRPVPVALVVRFQGQVLEQEIVRV